MNSNEQAASSTAGAKDVHTLTSLCSNQTEYDDHFPCEASVAPLR